MKFNRVGIKVRCVEGAHKDYPGNGPKTGEVYEVISVGRPDDMIGLKGVSGLWYDTRFELYEEEAPHTPNGAHALDIGDRMILSEDAQVRKDTPITTGVLDYFPRAMAAVAQCSKAGNDQHNPGQPLHWAKGKSTDHADCISRHLIDRHTVDTDGIKHAAKLAWRALALLETILEKEEKK